MFLKQLVYYGARLALHAECKSMIILMQREIEIQKTKELICIQVEQETDL